MIRCKQIPVRWSLVTLARGITLDASHLVVPPIPGSSITPLLSGLLPNRNHNDDLLQGLDLLPRGSPASQPLISVYAADPFMTGKQIAQRLLEKGYKRILNWPTTAQYGAEFCEMLDSVGLGPRQEYENLMRLAGQGLSISLAICSAEAAAQVARLRPASVFLAPTFKLWTRGRMRSRELLSCCAALARTVGGEIPIVLMSERNAISLAAARKAGASALLVA